MKKQNNSTAKKVTKGPSLYELEYLQELGKELEIFLHSKTNGTIKNIFLGVHGDNYNCHMRLHR